MGHCWRLSICSGSLDKRCHPLIINGRKCNRTSGGLGEMGISGEYLEKGGMVYEKGGEVLCGGGESGAYVWVRAVVYDPPWWRNPLRGFTTGRRGGWWIWDPHFKRVGHGCTHPLVRSWQWWDCRRSWNKSTSSRIRSHIKLRLVLS